MSEQIKDGGRVYLSKYDDGRLQRIVSPENGYDYETRSIAAAWLASRALAAQGVPECCCGYPSAKGVFHRNDGPCYMDHNGVDYRPSAKLFRHPHCGLTLTRDAAPDDGWHWSVTMPNGHLYDVSLCRMTFEQALADLQKRGVVALDAADAIWRRTHATTPLAAREAKS